MLNNYFSKAQIKYLKSLDELRKATILIEALYPERKSLTGDNYVLHLTKISYLLDTKEEKTAALLMTVIRDFFDEGEKMLIDLGFSDEVINLVKLISQNGHETLSELTMRVLKSQNQKACNILYAALITYYNANTLYNVDENTYKLIVAEFEEPVMLIRKRYD